MTNEIAYQGESGEVTAETVRIYLNDLRRSGITNMFGAAPYLQEAFGFDDQTAKTALVYWMKNFREGD